VRISHRHHFVFFSNPKTGSSTVRQFLDPWCDVRPARNLASVDDDNPFHPHMRPEEARDAFDRFGWDFGRYTRFVCVRNPWARLVSLYHHVGRTEELPPFPAWLRTVTDRSNETFPPWRRYGAIPLDRFVRDRRGSVLVDRVIRTEELDRELLPYLRGVGLPIPEDAPLPLRNQSGAGRDYPRYYTAETAALVEALFRYDVVNFGYRFGDPA